MNNSFLTNLHVTDLFESDTCQIKQGAFLFFLANELRRDIKPKIDNYYIESGEALSATRLIKYIYDNFLLGLRVLLKAYPLLTVKAYENEEIDKLKQANCKIDSSYKVFISVTNEKRLYEFAALILLAYYDLFIYKYENRKPSHLLALIDNYNGKICKLQEFITYMDMQALQKANNNFRKSKIKFDIDTRLDYIICQKLKHSEIFHSLLLNKIIDQKILDLFIGIVGEAHLCFVRNYVLLYGIKNLQQIPYYSRYDDKFYLTYFEYVRAQGKKIKLKMKEKVIYWVKYMQNDLELMKNLYNINQLPM